MNMWITIPVIILSTLTGTANFALDGFVPADDPEIKKYAQAAIGGVSIFAGILTTLGNFLRFAQGSESHRVAGIAWGKFQRQIAVELAIAPKDRIDCMDFLKICRAELDRLIEQSPPVPDDVISEFKKEFEDKPNVKKPEICDGMEHTTIFDNRESALKMITAEAALTLMHKKKLLRNEIVPDLTKLIKTQVVQQMNDLSGAIVEIHQRSRSPGRRASIDRRLPTQTINLDGNWKRVTSRQASPERTEPSERQNTVSDIHIEVVGAPTLQTEERVPTEA